MKKLVLVLLVAMLSVPAFAVDPSVTLVAGSGTGEVDVMYARNDANLPSGFGLTISVSSGTITQVKNLNAAYNIYPGSIDINDTTGVVDNAGSPVVGTLPAASIILEMGALYQRGVDTPPANSGRLCTIVVSANCTVTVAGNDARCGAGKGLVAENFVAYPVSGTLGVTVSAPAPTIASITVNSANPGTTATFTDIAGTNFVTGASVKLTRIGQNDIAVTTVFVSSTKLTGSVVLPLLTKQGTWSVVVTNPDAQTGTLVAGFTVNDCFAQGAVGSAQRLAYDKWVDYGRPSCWCFKKNCRGDADGILTGNKPVMIPDLTIFKDAYNKSIGDAKLVATRICADFDRINTGNKPVMIPDLTIFKNYYNDLATTVPQCDAAPVPTNSAVNFWTN